LVVAQVSEACAALGSMAGLPGEILPAWPRFLTGSSSQARRLLPSQTHQWQHDIEKARLSH
jgi:hypothetical protein